MRDEIRQQPAAIERTLKAEWPRAEKLRRHFEQNPVRLIVLAARGTSDNAAQFGRYLFEISTGIPVSLAAPSVSTLYGSQINFNQAVVVAFRQIHSVEPLVFQHRVDRDLAISADYHVLSRCPVGGTRYWVDRCLVDRALCRSGVVALSSRSRWILSVR